MKRRTPPGRARPRGGRAGFALGLDIVEIARIGRSIRDPRFLARVFTAQEVAYCRTKRLKAQHYAVRFAAKEAVWKALGEEDLALKDVSIRRGPTGKPEVLLRGRPAPEVQVSLSHSDRYAAAVAMRIPRQ